MTCDSLLKQFLGEEVEALAPYGPCVTAGSLIVSVLDSHLVETLAHGLAVFVGYVLLSSHGEEELTELLVIIVGTLLQLGIILLAGTVCHKRLGILKPTTAEHTDIREEFGMHD